MIENLIGKKLTMNVEGFQTPIVKTIESVTITKKIDYDYETKEDIEYFELQVRTEDYESFSIDYRDLQDG